MASLSGFLLPLLHSPLYQLDHPMIVLSLFFSSKPSEKPRPGYHQNGRRRPLARVFQLWEWMCSDLRSCGRGIGCLGD